MAYLNVVRNDLAARMKDYEQASQTRLVRRMPCIIRVDGRAFHTLTRGMEKPFDQDFISCMTDAAETLCEEIQGAMFAYVYSDEISVLLSDYKDVQTDAWFDAKIQKITSVSASIATAAFILSLLRTSHADKARMVSFDSRAFNLPHHEVVNYFIWRQSDCTRNAVSALAQAHFSPKELHGMSGRQMQDKLMLERQINFNDMPSAHKQGTIIERQTFENEGVIRHQWTRRDDIEFSLDRDHVDRQVYQTDLFQHRFTS